MAGKGQDIRKIAELAGRDPDRLPNVATWQPRADPALQAQYERLGEGAAGPAARQNPARDRQAPARFRQGGRSKKSRRHTRKHKKTRRHHRKH